MNKSRRSTILGCCAIVVFSLLLSRDGWADTPSSRSARERLNSLTLSDALIIPSPVLRQLLQEGAGREGDDLKFAWIYGLAELLDDDYEAAIGHLSVAIEKTPNSAPLHLFRARTRWALGIQGPAVEDCRKSLELDHDFVAARCFLAAMTMELDGVDAALEITEQINEMRERGVSHGDTCFEGLTLGAIYLAAGRHERAIPHLDKALSGSSTYMRCSSSEIWLYKSIAHQCLGDLKSALFSATRVAELEPDDDQTFVRLMELHLRLGDKPTTRFYAAKLAERDLSDSSYRGLLIRCLCWVGDYEMALQEARESLEIDSNDTYARSVIQVITESRANEARRAEANPTSNAF